MVIALKGGLGRNRPPPGRGRGRHLKWCIPLMLLSLYAASFLLIINHTANNHNENKEAQGNNNFGEYLDRKEQNLAIKEDTLPNMAKYISKKLPVDLGSDGGFCPATQCKVGQTSIREAFSQAPEATNFVLSNPANKWTTLSVDNGSNPQSFEMLLRDPKSDTFISGALAAGRVHDPHIRQLVVKYLGGKSDAVFIDIGANLGYFTSNALAVGARTISFEPFYENAGVLMSTVQRNGWREKSTIYMNAVGYESNVVTMKSTSDKVNKSNMHITKSECVSSTLLPPLDEAGRKYGIDYMESVSLDQVMLRNHQDIQRVQLMKIDVETFEMQVLNGAMYTLCNKIVERIAVEVEYLKPNYNLPIPCSFDQLQKTMIQMNYEILDASEMQVYTNKKLPDFPQDVVFKLRDVSKSPADQLRGLRDNPCAKFDTLV